MSTSAYCPSCRPEMYQSYESKRSYYAERADCLSCKEAWRASPTIQGSLDLDSFCVRGGPVHCSGTRPGPSGCT